MQSHTGSETVPSAPEMGHLLTQWSAGSIPQPGFKTGTHACLALFSRHSLPLGHCLRAKLSSCSTEARSKTQPPSDRLSRPSTLPVLSRLSSDVDSQVEPHSPFSRSYMHGLNLATRLCLPNREINGRRPELCPDSWWGKSLALHKGQRKRNLCECMDQTFTQCWAVRGGGI